MSAILPIQSLPFDSERSITHVGRVYLAYRCMFTTPKKIRSEQFALISIRVDVVRTVLGFTSR